MEIPEPVQRGVLQRYASLLVALHEELGERPLVRPTSDFFPDTFKGDERSVKRLVKRMQKHAGMDDIPIRVSLVGEEAAGGGCGTGACGTGKEPGEPVERLVDTGEHWQLNIPKAELVHPVVLTANIARALATVFLMETRDEDAPLPEPVDVSVDLIGVALGFGHLLLSGSYIYSKSCGGPSVARVTTLGPAELALALAAFAARGGHSLKTAGKDLETTQADAFRAAREVVESNPRAITLLKEEPARIADGDFKLDESKPWIVRAFGRKKKTDDIPLDASIEELEGLFAVSEPKTKPKKAEADPDKDELKALVAEALSEARTDAE